MKTLSMLIMMFTMQTTLLTGQENTFGACSLPVDWSNIELHMEGLPEKAAKILIISNREFDPGS